MSAIDDLLDAYEAVADAARRLERSRGNHVGARVFCCEKGRCLICEEAYIRAEADLHAALGKLGPRQSWFEGDQVTGQGEQRLRPQPELEGGPTPTRQREIRSLGSGPAEYLRQFFTQLEKMKPRKSYDVSHGIGFRDDRLYVLLSLGYFRARLYVDALDENPSTAAQQVLQLWQTKAHLEEDI